MKKTDITMSWPNRERDLKLAAAILKKYANENSQCVLFQGKVKNTDNGAQAKMTLPPWLQELAAALKKEYGKHRYAYVLDNVLMRILSPLRRAKKVPAKHLRIFRNFAFFFFFEDYRSPRIH